MTPEEWNEASLAVMAEPMTEWRPGQKEAWELFHRKGGPVGLISGRRVGKTANALRFILCKMLTTPNLQCCFVGKTVQEAKQMAFQDPKFGLLRIIPNEMIRTKDLSAYYVELLNGSSLQLYGGRDPHKVRGRGFGLIVFDEPSFYIGGWQVIQNILIAFDAPKKNKGKSAGDRRREVEKRRTVIFCTTPMRNEITKLIFKKCRNRIVRIPTRLVLSYLDAEAIAEYNSTKDTPYGRREFEAKVVWEGDRSVMTEKQIVAGLLSGREVLAQRAIQEAQAKAEGLYLPSMWDKTVVSVDHAVGDIEKEERSRSGIIVMSRFCPAGQTFAHGYIHADRTRSGRAEDWVPAAVHAYYEFKADEMVVETNQGGNLIEQAVHKFDPNIYVHPIRANKSKPERALFAQQLAAQSRFHFAENMPELFDELMSFTGKNGPRDPKNDRADAFVQAARRLIRADELVMKKADEDEPTENWRQEGRDTDVPPKDWEM